MLSKLILFLLLPIALFANLASAPPMLILNASNDKAGFPKKFRAYEDLQVSASDQFSEMQLITFLSDYSEKPMIIVNLREESHGFINGHGVSFYFPQNFGNHGKALYEIENDEKKRLYELQMRRYITIDVVHEKSMGRTPIATFKLPCMVLTTNTEKQLCSTFGIRYTRLPITDHMKPKDEIIDQFVRLINYMPPNTWIHFHCSAGSGRTTMMLVMYDMMMNADKSSLTEIILRHAQNGGSNAMDLPAKTFWKYPFLKGRLDFLKEFYVYCQENQPSYRESWTSWKYSN